MAACTIKPEASPQFKKLCERWKRSGYRHIDKDLAAAFTAIQQDILACGAFRLQAGSRVEVYKYRQNSKDVKRGSSYGWRILALYHKPTGCMYPIIVYPKTVWSDVDEALVASAIIEIRQILGYCISPGCDGEMATSDPPERKEQGAAIQVKMQCVKCGAIQWATA